MKYLTLLFLASSITFSSMAQGERAKEKFVTGLFKNIKKNRLDLVVETFVDSIFIDEILNKLLIEKPEYAEKISKDEIHKESIKAENRLLKSLGDAYSKMSEIGNGGIRRAKLVNIKLKERKKEPVSTFRAILEIEVDTTLFELNIPDITFDEKREFFMVLSDKVRLRVKNDRFSMVTEVPKVETIEAESEIERVAAPPPPPKSERIELEAEEKEIEVLQFVEKMPEFPGGAKAMQKFVSTNIEYPILAKDAGIEGKVYISFIVEQDGSVNEAKILRDLGAGCGKEALRVVNKMPNWKPGTQRGKPVRVKFNLPVSFKLK